MQQDREITLFTLILNELYILSVFKMRLLTQNPCLPRGLLKEIWLMLRRHDHMAFLPSLLVMYSGFCFINTPALVNVILVM